MVTGTTELTWLPHDASAEVASFAQPSHLDTSFLAVVNEATALVVIPKGVKIQDVTTLNAVLVAQLKVSRRGVLAITYLEVEEYGSGLTEDEAVSDLLSSLAEYKDSLEKRQSRLADQGKRDLASLRQLFVVSD